MQTNIVILGIGDIMRLYGFSRREATRLLNTKGCPILPRAHGQNYRVVQEEFEIWLRTRKY